ncbi:hypothetical protein MKW94_015595 [Papaver nudicaule]|uniref:Uncharacterized protein n=1 Tax=Papaver nudicaule TaxID=74823 RepID=A0AA41UY23_PAPNU|nr:hypothetical protein [Papaver nudicaule]
MWLNRFAKVHQLEEDGSTFPSERFDLLPLDRVIERNKTTTFYTAVMGKLTSVSNIVIKPVEDYDQIRDVPMREIVIENQQYVTRFKYTN